jgi:hypothetical protein
MPTKSCSSPECPLSAQENHEHCILHEVRDHKTKQEIEIALAEFASCKNRRIKHIYLAKANLKQIQIQYCNFQYSNLHGCDFQDSRFYKVGFDFSDVSECNFQHSILDSCDFRSVEDLRNVNWYHAIFNSVRFPPLKKLGYRCFYDNPDKYDPIKALNIYQNLRESYKVQGFMSAAGIFYELEMNMRRNIATGKDKLWLTVLWLMCGYGERPLNVVFCFLLTISGFAGLYSISHLEGPNGSIENQFDEALYFSIVTFTSLGYGDIRPVGIAKLFAGCEAVTGLFLTSLFIFVFCRKMLR